MTNNKMICQDWELHWKHLDRANNTWLTKTQTKTFKAPNEAELALVVRDYVKKNGMYYHVAKGEISETK